MITAADLVYLPFTPDLSQAGVRYACRSLAYTYDRMGGSDAERMRRIVAGKAAELALRRHLLEEQVPFDAHGSTPFTDPDHYDLALGGRPCDLKSTLILSKTRISRLRRDPGLFLKVAALVPLDQAQNPAADPHRIYLFALVSALVTQDETALQQAQQAGQPVFFIHTLGSPWALPPDWDGLGRLALKSEGPGELRLELGGQTADHSFLSETLELQAGQRNTAQGDYYNLLYLHSSPQPSGRLGLHSPQLGYTEIIPPDAWENIWVYGLQVVVLGFMRHSEFIEQARVLPRGSRVFQYPQTRTANLALPASQLHPLRLLFAETRAWRAGHR